MKRNLYFCSWSGGHESGLTLYSALKNNQILCLIASLQDISNPHKTSFFSPAVLRAQSDQINIPLLMLNTNQENFAENYSKTLNSIKKHNITGGFFATTAHLEQKEQYTQLCQASQIDATFPLFNKDKEGLLSEFIELGFKAKIIAINERYLTRELLAKDLDKEVVQELRNRKVDLFGENGEFLTVLYDAPFFKHPLQFKEGDINLKNGYWVIDLNLISAPETSLK